jgi:hypothetical protein
MYSIHVTVNSLHLGLWPESNFKKSITYSIFALVSRYFSVLPILPASN